jgi:hypothetical protein
MLSDSEHRLYLGPVHYLAIDRIRHYQQRLLSEQILDAPFDGDGQGIQGRAPPMDASIRLDWM